MSELKKQPNRALRWFGTVAAATGLFVGSLGIAGAASSHKASLHDAPAPGASIHRGPHDNAPDARHFEHEVGPHLGGQVVAVSSSTVTVADHDGFWRTINLGDTTTYRKLGVSATKDAVTVGTFVAARGTVNADHTSLDATSLDVAPTPPHGGPSAPLGHP